MTISNSHQNIEMFEYERCGTLIEYPAGPDWYLDRFMEVFLASPGKTPRI